MFAEQRRRLVQALPAGAAALLTANDILPTNADGIMRFFQNVNLYYLTGIKEEDSLLLLCPGHPDAALREVLFIKRTDTRFVQWNGQRLNKADAAAISGIDTVLFSDELTATLKRTLPLCEYIYLYSNEHPRSENLTQTREDRLRLEVQQLFPLHRYRRLYPLLARQRMAKTEAEIAMMRKACAVSEAGFRRLLRFVRPGVACRQVEAELIHEYLQHGAAWADYEPIVAPGAASCVLHYRANNTLCKDGDVVLIDAAASWEYYNADLTRTIPVNGRFTPRQKEYYNAVLQVHRQVRQHVKAGVPVTELWAACNEYLLQGLTSLGLCSAADIRAKGAAHYLRKYCPHNFAHFLGLDVHDVGYFHEPLPAGAVITNEPGIYCAEEGIGVRIENNLLVRENGYEDLMASIPVEAEEIEMLMHAR